MVGRISNLMQKMNVKIGARTKFGNVTPNVEADSMPRSNSFVSRIAAMVPIEIPTTDAKRIASRANRRVIGIVRPRIAETFSCVPE